MITWLRFLWFCFREHICPKHKAACIYMWILVPWEGCPICMSERDDRERLRSIDHQQRKLKRYQYWRSKGLLSEQCERGCDQT